MSFAGAGILPGMFESCTLLMREDENVPDGQGGSTDTWAEGDKFQAFIRKDDTREAERADRQDIREKYTVAIPSEMKLRYGDVFVRDSDGATFRALSNSADSRAPEVSTIQITKVTAERWEVPR